MSSATHTWNTQAVVERIGPAAVDEVLLDPPDLGDVEVGRNERTVRQHQVEGCLGVLRQHGGERIEVHGSFLHKDGLGLTRRLLTTAPRLLHAPADEDARHRPRGPGPSGTPTGVEPPGDDRRGERPGRVHADAPLIGPANSASRAITAPTATPASTPFSFDPVETLRITNMRISVRMNSSTNDWTRVAGREGGPERRVDREHQPAACTLASTAPRHWPAMYGTTQPPLEPAGGEEPEGDGRVQVAAGHVAHGVDHRQHDQPEGEGDADVR